MSIDPRTDAVLRAIRRILRAAELADERLAEATGLTSSQLLLLQEVARRGEMLPTAAATALRCSQATVTNLTDRLESLGLVARRRGAEDRRQVWIAVTDKGRAALADAPDPLHATFAQRFQRLADWEQAMVMATLERVTALLDADGVDAASLIDVDRVER